MSFALGRSCQAESWTRRLSRSSDVIMRAPSMSAKSRKTTMRALASAALIVLAPFAALAQPCPPVGGVPCTSGMVFKGTLNVDGGSGGLLNSSGAATLSAGGTFSGTFAGDHTYSGAITMSSALGVAGATTLSSTLGVAGAVSLTGSGTALAVTNNATIGGTLGVTAATTLSGGGALSGTFSGSHTLSGSVTFSSTTNPLLISRNAAISTVNNRAISSFNNYSGTYSGGATVLAAHVFNVTADNVAGGAAGGLYNGYFAQAFGRSNVTGHRTGLWSELNLTAATGNVAQRFYTALGGKSKATVNDGGAALGWLGNIFGTNILAELSGTATYYNP